MAVRLNRKFIIIVGVTLVVAAATVAGLAYLQWSTSGVRNIRAGDELMEAGQYEQAYNLYGRAVAHDPSIAEYRAKMEEALLKVRPETSDKARSMYNQYLALLRHGAIYDRNNPDAHLRLLREMHNFARFANDPSLWLQLAEHADEMWRFLPEHEPQRTEALLYRGIAGYRRTTVAPESEIEQADADLVAYLEENPDSDRGWAALLTGRMAYAQHLRRRNRTRQLNDTLANVSETATEIQQRDIEGPETARAMALWIGFARAFQAKTFTEDEVAAAVDRLATQLAESDSPMLLAESIEIFRSLDQRQGVLTAIKLLDDYLADHPDAILHQLVLARLHFMLNELDEARAVAEPLIDREPLPTSLGARIQPIIRAEAASLLVDVAFRRWELNPDTADNALARLRDARQALAGTVAQTDTHPSVRRADALIAYMQRDYNAAAAQFDELRRLGGGRDVETLRIEAATLERIGQIGLARQRLLDAVEQRPHDAWLQSNIARLSMTMRDFDAARTHIDAALDAMPDDPSLLAMADAIAAQLDDQAARGPTGAAGADAVPGAGGATVPGPDAALRQARTLLRSGAASAASALLEQTLADHPEDLRLPMALAQVALAQGDIDAARMHIDRGLAIAPDNASFQSFREQLRSDDPVDMIRRTIAAQYPDEADRVVMTYIAVEQTARQWSQQADRAEQQGDHDAAAAYRQRAGSLQSHARHLRDDATSTAPNDPALLEFQFTEALRQQNWQTAQALVERARTSNADQAGGLMYAARLELTRGNHVEAVRLLIEVTQRMRYASQAWRMLGSAYRAVGNVNDAQRAFEQAYAINPNDLLTLQEYASLLISTGDRTRALELIRRAYDLAPHNTNVREIWLDVEFEYGNPRTAIVERQRIYERNPNNRRNALRLAHMFMTATPQRQDVVNDSGSPRFEPRQWNALGSQHRAELLREVRAQWIASADQVLASLAEDRVDAELVAHQAELLRRRGRLRDAEQHLRNYVESADDAEKADALMALADFYRRADRIDDAVATMRDALPYQPDDERPIDLALGDLLLSYQRHADAAEHYRRVLDVIGADDADTPPAELRRVRLRLTEALGNSGRFNDARQVLSRARDSEGESVESVLLGASIDGREAAVEARRGNTERARTLRQDQRRKINLAIEMSPTNPLPLVQLAASHFEEYQRTRERRMLDEASLALSRASSLRADFAPIFTTRAEILFATGERDRAANELEQLLQREPGNTSARQRLVQMLLASNRPDAAVQTIERAIEHDPNRVTWHEQLGDLLMSLGRTGRAVNAFQNAWSLQRDNVRLAKLAEAMLRDTSGGRPDYARIAQLIEQSATSDSPSIRTLLAQAYYGQGRREAGDAQMHTAYQMLRGAIDADRAGASILRPWFQVLYRVYPASANEALEQFVRSTAGDAIGAFELDQLAEAWSRAGASGMDRALSLAKEAVEKAMASDSPDPQVQALALNRLGVLYYRTGEYSAAVQAFQSHLELDSDNAEALNNLAFVMARHTGQAERALAYAQRAIELQPNNANFLDTLGVIYTILDRLDDAEEVLRQAVALNASLASSRLHLGQALAAKGRTDEARAEFEQALALDPRPETRQQVEDALAALEENVEANR